MANTATQLRKLVGKNKIHHNVAVRALSKAPRVMERTLRIRERHLDKLSKVKGFEWVNERFSLPEIYGKKGFKLMTKGLGQVQMEFYDKNKAGEVVSLGLHPHKVAFVLDPLGRMRFFVKNENAHIEQNWTEIRHFARQGGKKPYYFARASIYHDADLANSAYELKLVLNKLQKHLTFDPKNSMGKLSIIRKLL
jgi:hypothetical protein